MKNSYEVSEAVELGSAQNLILGMKVEDPFAFDDIAGMGWRTLSNDIEESDE